MHDDYMRDFSSLKATRLWAYQTGGWTIEVLALQAAEAARKVCLQSDADTVLSQRCIRVRAGWTTMALSSPAETRILPISIEMRKLTLRRDAIPTR